MSLLEGGLRSEDEGVLVPAPPKFRGSEERRARESDNRYLLIIIGPPRFENLTTALQNGLWALSCQATFFFVIKVV